MPCSYPFIFAHFVSLRDGKVMENNDIMMTNTVGTNGNESCKIIEWTKKGQKDRLHMKTMCANYKWAGIQSGLYCERQKGLP